jgi:flagellar hook-associated protein 1 FlgK
MASSLINIGRSGALAARSALELTGQNIANANNPDYARRSLVVSDMTATGNMAYYSDSTLSGVRVEAVRRSDAVYLQNQARRTGGDAERAGAELSGLLAAESAIDTAEVYPAITEFEAGLAALQADPQSPALRAAVLENGRTLAASLQQADNALNEAGSLTRFQASAGVDTVNTAATELARLNQAIVRTQPGTSARATLLDQRDAQLASISEQAGIVAEYQANDTVNVRLGDGSGAFLVAGDTASALALTENPDGTIDFTLAGAAANPGTGALTGHAQALVAQRDSGTEIDNLAGLIITEVNNAQASGADSTGASGQPFFAGSDASTIAVVLSAGSGIAAAAAGSPASSRDTANLSALRTALASDGGPASEADRILYELGSSINGRTITSDALTAIAESAAAALSRETAVDLDQEAANLVRYQQAFQASGRVIEVARNIFDTILAIR